MHVAKNSRIKFAGLTRVDMKFLICFVVCLFFEYLSRKHCKTKRGRQTKVTASLNCCTSMQRKQSIIPFVLDRKSITQVVSSYKLVNFRSHCEINQKKNKIKKKNLQCGMFSLTENFILSPEKDISDLVFLLSLVGLDGLNDSRMTVI